MQPTKKMTFTIINGKVTHDHCGAEPYIDQPALAEVTGQFGPSREKRSTSAGISRRQTYLVGGAFIPTLGPVRKSVLLSVSVLRFGGYRFPFVDVPCHVLRKSKKTTCA